MLTLEKVTTCFLKTYAKNISMKNIFVLILESCLKYINNKSKCNYKQKKEILTYTFHILFVKKS